MFLHLYNAIPRVNKEDRKNSASQNLNKESCDDNLNAGVGALLIQLVNVLGM